jgi:heme O synthase-like polyprenyltransferase
LIGDPLIGFFTTRSFLASCMSYLRLQVIEVVNDGQMKRTMRRPLPSGRMSRAHALSFAIAMGVGGVSLLAYKVRPLLYRSDNWLTMMLWMLNGAQFTERAGNLENLINLLDWVPTGNY